MTRTPKTYIETSVFNFYFSEQDAEKRQHTLKLFVEIAEGKYEPYTSAAVIEELNQAQEPKKSRMLNLVKEYGIKILEIGADTERLADVYVQEGIIPQRFRADAVHIASTSTNDLNFITSYNFQHIVKRKTIELTEVINVREGYKRVGIYSPTEVIENEE
jgi:hypothetical protein